MENLKEIVLTVLVTGLFIALYWTVLKKYWKRMVKTSRYVLGFIALADLVIYILILLVIWR